MKDKAASMNMTMDQVITLASMIQAEAANVDDMYMISSIFHNRLRDGAEKGVATLVSTAEGLAGARLDKCGGDLKKAFKWSSTKIKYWGSVGKPKKGQNQVEYYATYGFKNGKGDCYVMAATFCMMAKVKGYKNVKMVKGTVPQANGKNGAHGWCEIKIGKTVYAYDPNFAYTYRNSNVKHHSGYKFTYKMLGKGFGLYKYNLKKVKRISC